MGQHKARGRNTVEICAGVSSVLDCGNTTENFGARDSWDFMR